MFVRSFAIVASVIFGLVALMHLVRVLGQWPISIDGWNVPMGLSYVGVLVFGLLSGAGFWAVYRIQRFLS